jgi:hypothetical protein
MGTSVARTATRTSAITLKQGMIEMGELRKCPFCGEALEVRNTVNPYGRCQTAGCFMGDRAILINDPRQVDSWNRRAREALSLASGEDDKRIGEIVTRLYRRFKGWSERGFGPEDVTWCEVKADVIEMCSLVRPSSGEGTVRERIIEECAEFLFEFYKKRDFHPDAEPPPSYVLRNYLLPSVRGDEITEDEIKEAAKQEASRWPERHALSSAHDVAYNLKDAIRILNAGGYTIVRALKGSSHAKS